MEPRWLGRAWGIIIGIWATWIPGAACLLIINPQPPEWTPPFIVVGIMGSGALAGWWVTR